MKLRNWLDNWDMVSLKINASFLEMEWTPQTADKAAAWDLYIELLTRITTQPLPQSHGDEQSALESVYRLFPLTGRSSTDMDGIAATSPSLPSWC